MLNQLFNEDNALIITVIFFAVLILIIIVLMIIKKIKDVKQVKRLNKIGKKIFCEITKRKNSWTNIGWYSLYEIEVEPLNPKEKATYWVFKTNTYQWSLLVHAEYRNRNTLTGNFKNYVVNEKDFLWKEVVVLVNPNDYKDYLVDTGKLNLRKEGLSI